MQPHVQRMLAESGELGSRLERLSAFIDLNPLFRKLAVEEQVDLRLQREAMRLYFDTLGRRIQRAGSHA